MSETLPDNLPEAVEKAVRDLHSAQEARGDAKGASWDEVVSAAANASGATVVQVEEVINALIDAGRIYEPILGRLRSV